MSAVVASAMAALALTACGTTVPLSQRQGASAQSGFDAVAPAGGSSGAGGGSSTGGGGSGLAGGAPGNSAAGSGAAGAAGGASVAGGSSPGGSGAVNATGSPSTLPGPAGGSGGPLSPGSARTQVRVGVVYLTGLDAVYKTAGAKSATTDSLADYKAVIAWINAHGGVGGAKMIGSYYAINSQSSTSPDTQLSAACSYFTQDVHVDVVVTYTPGQSDELVDCLRAKGVPVVDAFSEADVSASALTADPYFWEPAQVNLDRLADLLPTALVGEHWVDGRWGSTARCATVTTPRVGVVTFEGPDWQQAYNHDLAPTFARLGHPVYDAVFLTVSGTTANQLADASAGVQNAVLKFSSECIDHVAFVSNVAVDYLFMNVAQSQGYSPRYGLSSLEAPPVIIQNLASPGSQLQGALGVGWSPYSDVDTTNFDAQSKAPAAKCIAILAQAGLAPTDNNSAILALPSCDGPFFVQAAFARWYSGPSGSSLLDAVNGLGSSYQPSGTFSSLVDAQQHDGVSSYRQIAFVASCTCFQYTSGLKGMS